MERMMWYQTTINHQGGGFNKHWQLYYQLQPTTLPITSLLHPTNKHTAEERLPHLTVGLIVSSWLSSSEQKIWCVSWAWILKVPRPTHLIRQCGHATIFVSISVSSSLLSSDNAIFVTWIGRATERVVAVYLDLLFRQFRGLVKWSGGKVVDTQLYWS